MLKGRKANRLQSEHGKSTSGDSHELSSWHGGSTSVGLDGGGGSRWAGTVGWGLDLTVRDLGDWLGGRGRGLDLTVTDLGDNTASGGSGRRGLGGAGGGLDLAVTDLGDWLGRRGTGGGLDLTVTNLGDWLSSAGGGLDLTVGDLSDDLGSAGGGLNLTVGDLADWLSGGRGLDLTVGNLGDSLGRGWEGRRNNVTTTEDVNVDWNTLSTLGLGVEVVERARQALVEDGGATKGKGAVGASRPASGVDLTSLTTEVELELVVGGDVTNAASSVLQETIVKSAGKSSWAAGTLGVGLGDVDDGDLKLSVVRRCAASWVGLLWGDGGERVGGALGSGGSDRGSLGGSEASSGGDNSEALHSEGVGGVVGVGIRRFVS